ncbi:hypothetical protein WOLCODRAFT_104404 [Wolfiporia cocos MD-104 SS10]|uniref:BTB domain-containing protein n=1 Tax=Wolfiporia cocos (strain MD-104) TaxID=742152 RepID=A0A2H3K656_WOLCO|nr:hypothetical protein WOLCODRAFT_104404 [Wolfiporia cocos MD-104 SS10]
MEYHPLFSSPDGDIVLVSTDRTLFRIHSYTLKTTSGFFRTMFSLPSPRPPIADNLYLSEPTDVLASLLTLISGLQIPIHALSSFDTLEPLLDAAEKYDMPGPVSVARALATTPTLLASPLRLYALCARHGWAAEARIAARETLTLDLHAPEHRTELMKLGTPALLSLFALHRARREALRRRLNDAPFVSDGTDATCSHCGRQVDYHTWRELKYVIVLEMDVRPLGDTICPRGLMEWPAARACWDARCANCDHVLYDKKETLRVIQECIDQLPTAVDDGVGGGSPSSDDLSLPIEAD